FRRVLFRSEAGCEDRRALLEDDIELPPRDVLVETTPVMEGLLPLGLGNVVALLDALREAPVLFGNAGEELLERVGRRRGGRQHQVDAEGLLTDAAADPLDVGRDLVRSVHRLAEDREAAGPLPWRPVMDLAIDVAPACRRGPRVLLSRLRPMPDGALHGITILELGQMVSAPYCGQLFAVYGAAVVKIELSAGGDVARR